MSDVKPSEKDMERARGIVAHLNDLIMGEGNLAPTASDFIAAALAEERKRTALECQTCLGSGQMSVVTGTKAPYGDEITESVECAECAGTGVGAWGQTIKERDELQARVDTARAKGMEEAAEIAESHFIFGHSVAGPEFAKMGADKIRQAIEKEREGQ